MTNLPKCTRCDDIGWVCENHTDKPRRDGPGGCTCGAGAPCPARNVANADNPPRDPAGSVRAELDTLNEKIGDRSSQAWQDYLKRKGRKIEPLLAGLSDAEGAGSVSATRAQSHCCEAATGRRQRRRRVCRRPRARPAHRAARSERLDRPFTFTRRGGEVAQAVRGVDYSVF